MWEKLESNLPVYIRVPTKNSVCCNVARRSRKQICKWKESRTALSYLGRKMMIFSYFGGDIFLFNIQSFDKCSAFGGFSGRIVYPNTF